jgi:arginine exporter protein ArgO
MTKMIKIIDSLLILTGIFAILYSVMVANYVTAVIFSVGICILIWNGLRKDESTEK